MKKIVFYFLIIVTFNFCSFSFADSLHDNYIYFNSKFENLSNINFQLYNSNSVFYTSGQPYQGIYSNNDNQANSIDVVVGRSNSSTVFNELNNFLVNINSSVLTSQNTLNTDSGTNNTLPNSFNFAIFGTLSFDMNGNHYSCQNIALAQEGSEYLTNNFWLILSNIQTSYNNNATLLINCVDLNQNINQFIISNFNFINKFYIDPA